MSTTVETLPETETFHEPIEGAELYLGRADDTILLRDAAYLFEDIDGDFKKWDCNTPGPERLETAIVAHRLARRTKLEPLFNGISPDLESLSFNHGQIIQFAVRYNDWFSLGSPKSFDGGTFFLLKSGAKFFPVRVYRNEKNILRISIYGLENGVNYDPSRQNFSIIVRKPNGLPPVET